MTFLSDILASTRYAVAERRRQRPLIEVQANMPSRRDDRAFLRALQHPGVAIIAEFKRSSPSEGPLGRAPDLAATLQAYERGRASAASVLTERTKFGGSPEDLRTARAACGLPILCKDFVVDEYQVYEAAEAGADAILLIDAALNEEPGRLGHLHDLARNIALDVLVEVRNPDELTRALNVGAELIGINNRNLETLTTNLSTTRTLVEQLSDGVTVVSESGLGTIDHLIDLLEHGVDAALIGTALMNAADPEATCLALSDATISADEYAGRVPRPPRVLAV
jgi:indole-3-glycerol phosphate synthase